MRAEDLLKALNNRPFQPFRIVLADGKTYEVRHPELVIVFPSTFHVVIRGPDPMKPAEDYHTVALFHINRLEPLKEAPAASTN